MAETGAQALRLAATGAPDLIVLDLGLPDSDGKDVLRDIRAVLARRRSSSFRRAIARRRRSRRSISAPTIMSRSRSASAN